MWAMVAQDVPLLTIGEDQQWEILNVDHNSIYFSD